jgi:hypothetical protein
MNETQTTLLEQLAIWKVILVVFLATMAFDLFIFSGRTRELRADSGLANPILDYRFSYTPDQAYSVMKSLKSEGRQVYVTTSATEDLVFPLLYNLFLVLTMTAVFRAASTPSFQTSSTNTGVISKIQKNTVSGLFKQAARLPLIVLFSDYAENICLIILMLNYPNRLDWLARLSSVFTSLKWSLGLLCVVFITFGFVLWGYRKMGVKT